MYIERTPDQGNEILAKVSEDMEVYDADGDNIGSVERVYMGAVSEETEEYGEGPASLARDRQMNQENITDILRDIFAPETELNDEVKARLYREGFIRVDGGIFGSDYYVSPTQIMDVDEGKVKLQVDKDTLLED